MICPELGETRCRIGRLRGQRRRERRGLYRRRSAAGRRFRGQGRADWRQGRRAARSASAHETDAQSISAPHALDVVVIAPCNTRIRRVGAFVQKFPAFAPFELILRPAT